MRRIIRTRQWSALSISSSFLSPSYSFYNAENRIADKQIQRHNLREQLNGYLYVLVVCNHPVVWPAECDNPHDKKRPVTFVSVLHRCFILRTPRGGSPYSLRQTEMCARFTRDNESLNYIHTHKSHGEANSFPRARVFQKTLVNDL